MLRLLSDLLFAGYRQRVLGLLLLRPEQAYHVREIARLTDTPAGTLHKELSRLAEGGILRRAKRGNQVLYQADRACPIFEELASILRKTSGLASVIADALASEAAQIEAAFIFGSVAAGRDTAASDIDVMVIGDAGFSAVVTRLYPLQATLGREINPKVLSVTEWQKGVSGRDPFLAEVRSKPKIFLIGGEHDLAELDRNQRGGGDSQS